MPAVMVLKILVINAFLSAVPPVFLLNGIETDRILAPIYLRMRALICFFADQIDESVFFVFRFFIPILPGMAGTKLLQLFLHLLLDIFSQLFADFIVYLLIHPVLDPDEFLRVSIFLRTAA